MTFRVFRPLFTRYPQCKRLQYEYRYIKIVTDTLWLYNHLQHFTGGSGNIFMLLESVAVFFTSASWLRILLDSMIFLPIYLTHRSHELPAGEHLIAIPLTLVARDILFFFVPDILITFLSDSAIICLYFWWLHAYNPKLAFAKLTTIAISVVSVVLGISYLLMPGTSFLQILMNLSFLGSVIWFGVIIFNFSIYNTQDSEFLIQNRFAMIIIFIVTRIFLLFQSDINSPFAQWVFIPLSMVPHMFLVVRYLQFYTAQSIQRDEFNTSYINSLFDFMRTIGNAMTERIEVKSVLNFVIKSITSYLSGDAGVVMLRDSSEGVLRVGSMQGYFPPPFPVPAIVKTKLTGVQKFFENTPIKIGETVLGECAATNKPMFIRKAADDPRMENNTKDDTLLISSIILAPLIVNKEVFGIVALMRRKRDNLFNDADFERARIFIEYASLTLDSLYNYSQLLEKQEIEREVNIAATIQKKLLPTRTPKAISNMVAAFSKAAKGVSGDYYDIIPLNAAGKFALVICDVAGKGVPASLIMVMIRTIIHTIGGARKNAAEVVSWINRGIAGRVDIERFATLSYMTYDPVSNDMEYSNAGHHPIMIYRAASETIEKIDSPGLPIGLERDSEYHLVKFHLDHDDVILTYTDGILEAMDYRSEQFEEERLQAALRESTHRNPKEIVDHIRKRVDEFVGQAKQHDDMTLIVLKAQ